MSQIPIGWLRKIEGFETLPLFFQQVVDDADGIPVTGPSFFPKRTLLVLTVAHMNVHK